MLRSRWSATSSGSKPNSLVVHGLGGVGKTRLAVEYAWRRREEYQATFFVTARSEEDLRCNLANLVGHPPKEAHLATRQQDQYGDLHWFHEHSGWLFIIDGADTEEVIDAVRKLLPRLRRGHVLITSRRADWGDRVELFSLGFLEKREAIAFLLDKTERHRRKRADDHEQAEVLVDDLACFPLALELAAAHVNKSRISLEDYRKRWKQKGPDLLRWHDAAVVSYPNSLAGAWEATLRGLPSAERSLLRVLSLLAPEPLPVAFFESDELGPFLQGADARDALAALADRSLVQFDDRGETVRVHALVQKLALVGVEDSERRQALDLCATVLDRAFRGDPSDERCWPEMLPLYPHVVAVTNQATGGAVPLLLDRLGLLDLPRGRSYNSRLRRSGVDNAAFWERSDA